MNKTIRILIVEDDDSIREALGDFIKEEGYTFHLAHDGQDALEILKRGDFDPTLIILDLNMPRLSGKEFVHEREKLGLAPNASIIMLSATHALPTFPKVSAWIRKPIDLDSLLNAIKNYGTATVDAPIQSN